MKNIANICMLMTIVLLMACSNVKQDQQQESAEPTSDAIQDNDQWRSLFNSEDLSGWEVLGGDANFYVEDGMIVGLTEEDLPNCFLATQEEFSNFVLEVDFMIESAINSGVQIRSDTYEKDTTTAYLSGSLEEGTRDWEAGRVFGYQIEIDPSDRAWTGGFYEEGGRGWLDPLTENEEARNAFKPGEWNHFRIMAEGNQFKTWINDVPAVNTTDDQHDAGFIALQLHGAWKEEQIGQKVYFKNIRIKEI